MKTSTILASISLLFAAAVTAQTACDPVASAIPTCGVRHLSLLPSSQHLSFFSLPLLQSSSSIPSPASPSLSPLQSAQSRSSFTARLTPTIGAMHILRGLSCRLRRSGLSLPLLQLVGYPGQRSELRHQQLRYCDGAAGPGRCGECVCVCCYCSRGCCS